MLCERPRDGSWAGEKILSPDLKGSLRRALPFEAGPVNGICWSEAEVLHCSFRPATEMPLPLGSGNTVEQ